MPDAEAPEVTVKKLEIAWEMAKAVRVQISTELDKDIQREIKAFTTAYSAVSRAVGAERDLEDDSNASP